MATNVIPKLVIAFLVVITPLYVLGLRVNHLLESSVERELTYSLQSRLQYYTNTLEVEKEHMMHLMRDFAVDKDMQNLAYSVKYMSLYEWSETVRRLHNKLRMVQNSSMYIKNVNAHVFGINRTLSSASPIHERITEEYEAVRPVDGQSNQGFLFWEERMFLRFAYPESIFPRSGPVFVIGIELDVEGFRKSLKQFAVYDESGAFLFDPVRGTEVASDSDANAVRSLRAFLIRQHAQGIHEGLEFRDIAGKRNLTAYQYSPSLGNYLVMYIPYGEIVGQINSYRNFYWVLSVVALAVIIVYSYWLYRLIYKPLTSLVRSFRKVEFGPMESIALPQSRDEFLYLFQQYNRMIERLNRLIHEVYEQKIHVQSSELKQLQSQVNPHFLYNTYFILHRLVDMDDRDNALTFSRYLGEYFQYITRNAASEVPLESEYQHSKIYAGIQNVRFSGRIETEFGDLPERCSSVMVPKLILQPIIENAYKYGLEHKETGGRLLVRAVCSGEAAAITVEDNGEQLTDETLGRLQAKLKAGASGLEYTGLLNAHRRLQILYEGSGVSVERGQWGGMKVTLTIKCRTS